MLPVSLFLMPLWYSLTVISFIGQSQCHATFTQQRHLVFAINIPEIQLIVIFFWYVKQRFMTLNERHFRSYSFAAVKLGSNNINTEFH